MLRKSLKYILIALVNACFLVFLYKKATDDLRLLLTDSIVFGELLMILLLFFGIIISMGLMVTVIRKRSWELSLKQKVCYAMILTITLSSYFYIDYGTKVYNRYCNTDRQSLSDKIKSSSKIFPGSSAKGLTYAEYEILQQWLSFPELPPVAKNIAYDYSSPDIFFPDYGLSLNYEVTIGTEVETIEFETDQFSRNQNVEIIGDRKLVRYSEGRK